MNHSEKEYIDHYKRLVEEKFQFTNGSIRQRDFEFLSDFIEERSGILLSLSTLKRIWKKDYDQIPHPSTLDALVSLLGYKNWQEFKLKETIRSAPVITTSKKIKKRFPFVVVLSITAIALTLSWLIAFRTKKLPDTKTSVKGQVIFTGNKTVSQGVPNTVIFHYDLENVSADSFFFQQSWNVIEKVPLDPKNQYYSTVYYYPGFHRAKLFANDSVIKTFRVHITTNGWFPLVRYAVEDSIPIYLKKVNPIKSGKLYVDENDLAAAGVNTKKEFVLSYFNVREFENTNSDNFTLNTKIKMDGSIHQACPALLLIVMCEEDIFYIRLTGKGCEGYAGIKMGEVRLDGDHNDLSKLGSDLTSWQNIQLKVENKQATVFINQIKACSITFKKDFGKIMGLAYHFNGPAAINNVSLENGAGLKVYHDEFIK